jgi:hypothetical protein
MPEHTPIPGLDPTVQAEIQRLDVRHRECKESTLALIRGVDELARSSREILIELCGRSGKNGIVGELKRDVETMRKTLAAELAARRVFRAKIMGATIGTSGALTGLVQAIVHLI